MSGLRQEIDKLDRRTTSILDSFDRKLTSTVSQAKLRVALRLRDKLKFEADGSLRATAANVRVIQTLPTIFRQALEAEGYQPLVTQFLGSFDGGLPIFEDVLAKVADAYEVDAPEFSKVEQDYFQSIKESTALQLDTAIETAALAARGKVLFSVAGESFEKMAVAVAERLSVAPAQAQTIASTGITTFYRTVASRGYEKIEEALAPAGKTLAFTYMGPPAGDRLIRPFCRRLMGQASGGKTWSRDQIDRMNNDQLPDVFTTGGGYNCRHQWVVSLKQKGI